MALRRAYADEYAVRVNRAAVLVRDLVPADAVRALQAEFDLSERQARRYVNVALEQPEGVPVPERTAVFTVRLAPSLIGGLRDRAGATGQTLSVPEEFIFEDDGFSGASLHRPALERLRDRAFDRCFEVVLCHAPDRLARRYAYQVLLLQELARGGIEVVFIKEPERSGSPEDELLRQFQGMIAEYERAQIAERCRRGKLYRARAGAVSVLSHAPYGYRYVKKTEHADAFFEINELEAPIVSEIFARYVEQHEPIAQIAKSLTEQGVATRTGTRHHQRLHSSLGDIPPAEHEALHEFRYAAARH